MKRKISLFLVIVLLVGLLAGCGGSNGGNGGTGEEMDVVYYAYSSEPILNWDPSVMFSNGIIVLNNIYETLLRFDPETKEFEYVLAESYEVLDDGLTWIFKLREGVKFHDGTEFNAEAVKFSIDRTMELDQGASYIWYGVNQINVVDEYTVEFVLDFPMPLDIVAACPYAAFIMSPAIADQPDDWFEQGNEAGTGPYMLESSSMGDEVILTKYDDYWKGWEGEHFEKAIIKKTPETSSRRQMVEKGVADITSDLPTEDIEALKNNENVVVKVEKSLTNMVALLNTERAPLDNPKVRQALAYAYPYDDVVQYAVGGYAEQSTGVIPKGMWGHSDDLFQYSHDLDKAKALLEEAGIQEGELSLLLTYVSGEEVDKKSVELFKAELSKIGVELEIRGMPWESQWEMSKGNPENRQDIFLIYWWPDIAHPYSWLFGLFHTEESPLFNLSYYKSNEFDILIDGGYEKSGIDITSAETDFIKAQEILLEDSPAIFIFDKQLVWVTESSLKGFKDNPAYPYVVFFYDCYREK